MCGNLSANKLTILQFTKFLSKLKNSLSLSLLPEHEKSCGERKLPHHFFLIPTERVADLD